MNVTNTVSPKSGDDDALSLTMDGCMHAWMHGWMDVCHTIREYLLCMRVLLECLNLVLFALSGSELSICLAVSIHTVFCTC